MVSRWALEAGYQFLQALPLRRMTGSEQFCLPVFYREHAWNPVWSFGQARRHEPGAEGMPSCLNDWIASPNPDKCAVIFNRLPGREISHHFENAPGRLVELCPELGMSPEAIAEKCRVEGHSLVLDTEHLSRNWRYFDPRKGKKEQPFVSYRGGGIPGTVNVLAPYIQVVHLKSVGEMSQTLVKCLFRAEHQEQLDFVAEYLPLRRDPWAVRSYMREFLIGLRKLAHGK